MISKFGQLEFKHGRPENGRTMFEGIISSYPKRMDIWSVYLNLEAASGNKQQDMDTNMGDNQNRQPKYRKKYQGAGEDDQRQNWNRERGNQAHKGK